MRATDTCENCGARIDAPSEACRACGEPPPPASPYTSMWEAIRDRIARATAPRYVVSSMLGYGGMAGVYLANEPRLGRRVAIKVLTPALMSDPALVARFEQEARTIAQLTHPNIVTIYDVDERDGLYYFVMEYVPGRTLARLVADHRTEPLAVPILLHWIAQVASALTYAHRAGVIHRDVKPANIMLDSLGSARVTDFGIAKVADESRLTRTGFLVGTPVYMSPEQCGAGPVTGASDQYALGIVAYELLAGRPPFSGATMEILQAHLNHSPPPLVDLRPDCPEPIRTGIERMLAKRPEDRYATVAAAATAIGAQALSDEHPDRALLARLSGVASTTVNTARTGSDAEPRPPTPHNRAATPTPTEELRTPSPIHERRWFRLVAASVLIVVAAAAAAVRRDGRDEPAPEPRPPVQQQPPGRGASDSLGDTAPEPPVDSDLPGADTAMRDEQPGDPEPEADPPAPGAADPRQGELEIAGTLPPGTEVTIRDGDTVRRSTGGTIQLPPGSYLLEATAPVHDTVRIELPVESGGRATWSPSLTRLEALAPEPPVPATRDPAAVEAEVRVVIDSVLRALEHRDMDAVLRAFPGAADEWAQDWRGFYESKDIRNLQLSFRTLDSFHLQAQAVSAAFSVDTVYRDARGRQDPVFEFVASFQGAGDGWTLTELRQNR